MRLRDFSGPIDGEEALKNERQEKFCQKYLELTLDKIVNKSYKKLEAYKYGYEPDLNLPESTLQHRANVTFDKHSIQLRLTHLLEEYDSLIESKYKWIKENSENELISIIVNRDTKDADRLKAIQMLNELRGIKAKEEVKVEKGDPLTNFVKSLTSGGK